MSFEAVQQLLHETLQSEFAAQHPDVPMMFENAKYKQPKGAAWVYVALVPGDIHRKEISQSGLYCDYGVVNIACMVPEDKGTKDLQKMTDTIFHILFDRNWNLGSNGRLTTYGVKRRNRGLVNGFYTWNVLSEYRYEDRFVRA